MAQPFTDLPDPDELRPPGASVDPADHLVALGYTEVGAHLDPAEVARRLADTDGDHWRIVDEHVAEWAMAKLAKARAAIDAADRRRDEYSARIDQWHRRSVEPHVRDAAFFEAQLILWALEQRSQSGGSTKTVLLPSGEIRTRKPGPWKPSIADPQALIEWAIGQRDAGRPGLVRSRLVLDVLAASLADVAIVVGVADLDSDQDQYVVVDAATGERIPGTVAKRTEPDPKVTPYETS